MNYLCSLERWDRGFESHSRHGCLYCMRLFCVCVFVLCVGRGLAMGRSPVQGVLPTVYRMKKLKKKRPRLNKGLYSHNNNSIQFNSIPLFTCLPTAMAYDRQALCIHIKSNSKTNTKYYKL
jgi:hypothetical protein